MYVFSCWWDWDYGGCFGAREFCQQIAYLSIPMASIIEKLRFADARNLFVRLSNLGLYVFCFSCVCLNISQSYQYQNLRKIHPSATTEKLYWSVFRKFQFSDQFNNKDYWESLDTPAHDKWRRGEERDDIKKTK